MAHRREITNYNFTRNYNTSKKENISTIEKPISSVYNIYFNKEKKNNPNFNKIPVYNSPNSRKIKMPLYKTPFYSPKKLNKRINYKIIFQKNNKSFRNNFSTEYPSSFISSPKKNSIINIKNNTIQQDIYVRKSKIFSLKRNVSDANLQNSFKKRNSYLALTPTKIKNFCKNNNNKNMPKNEKITNEENRKKPNIININLYNEKNNYIENNIINKIYINKNKKNNTIFEKPYNHSLNSLPTTNNESIILTDRKLIPRRNNYSFYYSTNNNIPNKINNKFQNKGGIITKKSRKKMNNLPKVLRKPSKKYDESSIIKIQSIVRGYLLNKKLDKYLRHYMKINNGIKLIEKIYLNKFFNILANIKTNKKNHKFYNIYYSQRRKSESNNLNNKKNLELQFKINELINEKKELQNNYENLKEFIRKFKELEKENQEIKRQNKKLKQENEELLIKLNQRKRNPSLHKYKRYSIQKQSTLNIFSQMNSELIYKKYNINKEIKIIDNKNDFFTLGSEGKDLDDVNQVDKVSLKENKLRNIIKNKEKNNKFNLFKNFVKFLYKGIFAQNLKNEHSRKSHINIINRRYNNNSENSNLFNCVSIKTLSDNSSVFTDRRSQNLAFENKMIASNLLIEEDNKNK